MSFIVTLIGSWLGHGRRTEAALALIAFLYGVSLLISPADSQATRDIAWEGYAPWLALMFFVKSGFTGYGVLANISGLPYSQSSRCFGALVGSFLWTWMVFKFVMVGSPLTFGAVCSVVFLLLSIMTIGSAWAGLPPAGAPGAR